MPNQPKPEEPNKNVSVPVTAFTTIGLNPRSCVFEMTKREFEEAVLRIAQTFIPEFESCYFERSENADYDALCLWIPSNSEHLQDRKAIEGTVLKEAPRSFSPKMAEFIKRFCNDKFSNGPQIKDPRYRYGVPIELDRGSSVSRQFTAIAVNPKVFVDLMFDYRGDAYAEATGKRAITTSLSVDYVYQRDKDSKSPLKGIRVIKSMRDRGDGIPRTRYGIKV